MENLNPNDSMSKEVSFWNFNVGHLITIVLLGISVVGLYFKFDARLSAVELLATKTQARMEDIDQNGTRKSQLGLSSESEFVKSTSARVGTLETQFFNIIPKLERIDANVQWLMKRDETSGGNGNGGSRPE